jgi:putative ABC transport system permease protein
MLLAYTLRNLVARWRDTVPTIFALVVTIATTTLMLACLQGLIGLYTDGGDPRRALVLSSAGEESEQDGLINPLQIDGVSMLPQVAWDGREAMVSPEVLAGFDLPREDGELIRLTLRGVDPIALRVHTNFKVVSGALPASGTLGVMVGKQQLGKFAGMVEGGEIRVGKHRWPVTGVFEAKGTRFESELWADRRVLMQEMRRGHINCLSVMLQRPDQIDAFQTAVRKLPLPADWRGTGPWAIEPIPLDAMSEIAYLDHRTNDFWLYVRAVEIVILILAVGATLTCVNTMASSYLSRLREIATLLAIGFSRGRVALLLIQESLILAALGAVVGLAISLAAHGRTLSFDQYGLVYQITVAPRVLFGGLTVAAVIGLCSGLVVVFRVFRMQVLTSLRAA